MAKAEWGQKHSCVNCGARFYDLRNVPATCPACGTVQEQPQRTRRSSRKTVREEEPAPKPAVEKEIIAEDAEELEILDENEEDDDLMEDASDLGEDEDDMAEVREHMEGDDS